MNILVIGNGFDLAHGLQTTYKDFLKFASFFTYNSRNPNELNSYDNERTSSIEYFINFFDDDPKISDELDVLVKDNVWLTHFYNVQIKEGWIDFENEISKVIQTIEDIHKTINNNTNRLNKQVKVERYQQEILQYFNPYIRYATEKTIKETKEKGLKDLNRLIRCLEIYLSFYINNVPLEKTLPDIERLPDIDKILSFNYTNTYERLYTRHPLPEFDYIHGKANIRNNVDTNNMVLGINEYLKGDEKNENIEFIAFKKFYQRIHKETGSLYKNWVAEIKSDQKITNIHTENNSTISDKEDSKHHNIFIFGHSLDITDKDVLRDLILNDNVQTVIFYMNKDDYGRKIANLVKIIGQDELIRRTGGPTKTITFKLITEID